MAEEIFLEVVHHRHCLVKQFGGFASVHKNSLGTEHLRHLGEDRCSTLCHKPVGELSHERIGGDTAESVTSAAFQTHAQFAHRHSLSLVLRSLGIQVAQYFHTSLHLVAIHALSHEEFYSFVVIFAEQLFKQVGLVVFATESENEYATGIGMQGDVTQNLSCVLMIPAQLRATVVMMPCIHSVDVLLSSFLAQLVSESLCNTIYASHCRHNPYLVAHTYITVFPYVSLKGAVFLGDVQFVVHWFVGIRQCTLEVGLEIILIYPVTSLQVGDGMTDGISIFNNVRSSGSIVDEHLVSRRCVLVESDSFAIHFHCFTFFHCFKANYH